MEPVSRKLASYHAYHRNRWNRVTHFVGVPMIVFSLLLLGSRPRLGISGLVVSPATLLVAATVGYYLRLDFKLALSSALPLLALMLAADALAASLGPGHTWVWFAVLFGAGWVLQLAGHAIEGRRPAFVDDLSQAAIAPMYLVAQAIFATGAMRGLRDAVTSDPGRPPTKKSDQRS